MSKVFDYYAVYYDLLYKEKDYRAETEYVGRLLEENGIKTGAILELGCGTGKHAEQVAKIGYSVHGIDLSSEMIKEAKKRKPNHLSNQLYFEIGDICDYAVDKKFDAVISLFHVASYMIKNEQLVAMFKTAAKHLNPGGIFIFDFWYGPGVVTTPPTIRLKRLENEEVNVLRIAEPQIHSNENVVDVKYSVQLKKKNEQKIIELNEMHQMRYLFIPEIKFLSEPWFVTKTNFAWMKDVKPNFCDWLCISVLEKK